ncbi:beta-hydroxyacyl-ACP dehydratase [Methylolobus aquaticus]
MTESSLPLALTRFSVAPDHPALPGHFPGDPILPGVTLLERVFQLLEESEGMSAPMGLANVKFLAPLRPGDSCSIEIEARGPGHYRFVCRVGSRVAAHGDITSASSV